MPGSRAAVSAPFSFSVMLKPRGALCNLGCRYCYYLGKESLYPGVDPSMDDAVLEDLTRQYIEAQDAPEVTFAWQGGEPLLMGLQFFERAVTLQQRLRKPGMRIQNAIQTNATLVDADWCRFFRENGFLVGVSLDGPEVCHDAHRVDKAGGPTFGRVMAGLDLLQKHRVEVNILTAVNAANAGRPLEVYRFLRDTVGAQFVQLIPVVEWEGGSRESGRVTERSVSGPLLGAFLMAIFDEWVRRDVGRVFVQSFDVALGAWLGEPTGLCTMAPTCGRALALEHNGDVYACDHFVDPAYRLGNILETPLIEMVRSESQRRFGLDKRDRLPRTCRVCDVRFACHGECPRNRAGPSSPTPGLNVLCEGYSAFFRHIDPAMRYMAAQVHAGRPPASIMLYLARGGRLKIGT